MVGFQPKCALENIALAKTGQALVFVLPRITFAAFHSLLSDAFLNVRARFFPLTD